MPVYERLGNISSAAVTKGKIADILQVRGDLDEALRIRREEELPVFERLGDAREAAVSKWWIGFLLLKRGNLQDCGEAEALLRSALDGLRRMKLPDAERLATYMVQNGFTVE